MAEEVEKITEETVAQWLKERIKKAESERAVFLSLIRRGREPKKTIVEYKNGKK